MTKTTRLPYPKIIAADVIDRMKALYDVRTDRQLAEVIGVEDVIFTRWRNRDTFHKEVVFAVSMDRGIGINYLLFGHPENTVSAGLTASEVEVVRTICREQGLTESGLLRFSLRLYQEVCERFSNGERIKFSGNGRDPTVLITPMLGPLRARHAPRKQRSPKR